MQVQPNQRTIAPLFSVEVCEAFCFATLSLLQSCEWSCTRNE